MYLNFKVGDELLLAPLGLFNTEVFALTGQDKRGQGQANASGDPEDPHDANYLRETSVSISWKII
jgi:actin-related protein 8